MSKLFTEQEVKKAIALGYDWCHQKHIPDDFMIDNFINSLTPIQIPTDEEIINNAYTDRAVDDWEHSQQIGFELGAKWMRDKIKGGKGE